MTSGSSLSSESYADVATSGISEKCSSDDSVISGPHHGTQIPIAIVGMGCRLPGHSNSPTALWDLLERGGVAKNEPPTSRFSLAGHYDKDNPGRPRTMKSPGGMFMEDVDPALFDGQFFNISRTECIAMDPQQRQMLEVAYECLENSGTPMETLSGTNTGVIVGSNFTDYGAIQHRDPENRAESVMIGLAPALLSNRISHFLNIHGPSMTVDTACSAGLVSLDVACRYLDSFQTDAVLVGAANLWLSPEHNEEIGMMHVTQSGSAQSKSFDASADGYVKAEGVNCFFLKRLDDAVRNGDPIRAIIRGTAVNASGRTNGIANPSSDAQAAVTRQALKNANIKDEDFSKTRYLEAHGTGTLAGDPIEARGAASVFSKGREDDQDLIIGSIKSNIGHSEPSAGLSGLLKATMAVEKGLIPGTPTFFNPNPNIDWKSLRLKASRMSMPWPKVDADNIRRAGVNSFGSGANAHAVVENDAQELSRHVSSYKQLTTDFFDDDDDDFDEEQDYEAQAAPTLLFFSANDQSSLDEYVLRFSSHLQNPLVSLELGDLAYTLSERRSRHYQGAVSITRSNPQYINQETLIRGKRMSTAPRVAFIFTGQGAQWPTMGADLIRDFPLARSTVEYLDSVLQSLPSPPQWSLLEELTATRSVETLRQPEFSQPLVTALQIALLRVLEEWGIFPEAVVGHSSGEIAAAYAANLLSSSSAIKVAYYRGQSSKKIQSGDPVGMLATGIDEATLAGYLLEQKGNKIEVACYNSPASLTLSGLVSELEELRDRIQADGHFARLLLVDLAYHSNYMAEIGEVYEGMLHEDGLFQQSATHRPNKTSKAVAMFSSVTSAVVNTTLDAAYWKQNMVSPVRFAAATAELLKQSNADFLIELGPSNALAGPIAQIKNALGKNAQYTSALQRNSDSTMPIYEAAARLFLAGDLRVSLAKVNRLNSQTSKVIVDLPNYVWNHSTRYWHETRASKEWRFKKFIHHDLIGSKVSSLGWNAPIFRGNIKLAHLPWLRDHRLGTDVVFPATAYLAMAVEAMYQTAMVTKWKQKAPARYRFRLRDVKFLRALVLTEERETTVSLALTPIRGGSTASWYEYQMCSEQEGVDVDFIHSTGMVCVETDYKDTPKSVEPLELATSARLWYKTMAEMGYNFGPSFQKHLSVESTMGQRQNRSTISWSLPRLSRRVSLAVLDGCFQATTPSLWKGHLPQAGDPALVPKAIDSVLIESGSARKSRVATEGIAYASANYLGAGDAESARNYSTNVDLHDPLDGALLFQLKGLAWAEMETSDAEKVPHQFMHVNWNADIDMLMEGETTLSTTWLRSKTVQQVIDLVAHKSPELSVLEVNLSLLDGSNLWLEQGKNETDNPIRAGCSQYHFAVRDPKTLIQAQERFNSRALSPQFHLVMDVTKPVTITKADSIDLAIINPGQDDLVEVDAFLQSLALAVRDGGFIVSNGFAHIDSLGKTIHLSNGVSICRVEKQTKTALSIDGEAEVPPRNVTQVSILNAAAQDSISEEMSKVCDGLATQKWLLEHSVSPLEDISSNTGIVIVLDELFSSVMDSLDAKQWELLQHLSKVQRPLLWVTSRSTDPTRAAAVGFLATIRAEEQVPFFTLDVEASTGRTITDAISACLGRVWDMTSAKTFDPRASTDFDFVERGGTVLVSRVYRDSGLTFGQSPHASDRKTDMVDLHKSDTMIKARCERLGNLDSVHFGEVNAEPSPLPDGMVEVEIHAAGISYKDVVVTLGTAPGDETALGQEAAGVVTKVAQGVSGLSVGDRVVVFDKGCFANRIHTRPGRLHRIPDSMTFEEAATFPTAYITAIHALLDHASLSVGKSVLIHSAAGGVGIAAIQIAQSVGAEVYATVGTPEKKEFLKSAFGLADDRIFHSRSPEFGDQILSATNGRGMDVILNSLTGDVLDESFRVLADRGIMVELGKRDVLDRNSLPWAPFDRNSSFRAVDLSPERATDSLVARLMSKLFELIEEGSIKPIAPVHKFAWTDIPAAFHYLRPGTHIGKVVLTQDSRVEVPIRRAPKSLNLRADGCYLIVSSLRGLCGGLAIYLAQQGAKHLAVMSRSGYADEKSRFVIKQITALGCHIDLLIADVTNADAVAKAMKQTTVPIVGIIQGAMVLRDRPFESMTLTEYHEALQCKIRGTWNLHNASESLQLKLDSFTMLSSLSGIIGHVAQANYAAGNVFLDAFAAWRRTRGLPACSIDLGISEDSGVIAESAKLQSSTEKGMFRSLNEGQLRRILYFAMLQQKITPSASDIGTASELAFSPMITGLTFPQPDDSVLKSDARFSPLFSNNEGPKDLKSSSENANADIQALFLLLRTKSADPASRLKAIIDVINGCFMHILRLNEPMDPERPTSVYGTDSLAAVEIRNWVRTELGCLVTTLDIMTATSLTSFCEKILTKLLSIETAS
ncbi:Fumagillin dodecapentaenoate synthase [Lachnellula occidentalis]|uniref:Fumagillin dodecapentaenoate synthase n=1 Tax=Lachnellula occidentalis TaxID=215460 RepID=A0A8H8RSJ1_9HELO|nr:Fumagillin dodecapentaenoate synthase [Lachnellula occidentalis]